MQQIEQEEAESNREKTGNNEQVPPGAAQDLNEIEVQVEDKSVAKEPEPVNDYDSFFTDSFIILVCRNYQKSTFWFMVAVAFCAMRSATTFIVTLAYLQVICRVVQLIGTFLKKRMVARIGYGAATAITMIMFFGAMIDEGHLPTF